MRCPTLRDLPPPPEGRTGWPWTEESPQLPEKAPDGQEWPKVSIITPSYQQGQFIEETIRSVLLQGYRNIEYIVMDGGSRDETLSILNKYNDYIQWTSEADNGQVDAINKGWKRATGSILAYLNSDDTYVCGTIDRVIHVFTAQQDVDMVYGDIMHIDQRSEIIARCHSGPLDLKRYLCCDYYLPQPTVFFRTKVTEEIGYLDPKLNLAMDLDYWLRILQGHNVEYLPLVLANARLYPDAKSSSQKCKYLDERLYILDKLFSRPELPPEISTFKSECYSTVYLQGACDYLEIGKANEFWECFKKSLRSSQINCLNLSISKLLTSLRVNGFEGIVNAIRNSKDQAH